MREIKDEEVILLINKYLIVDLFCWFDLKEKGFIKTEKIFRKENIAKEIDYSEVIIWLLLFCRCNILKISDIFLMTISD